jgi:hypothetical protein
MHIFERRFNSINPVRSPCGLGLLQQSRFPQRCQKILLDCRKGLAGDRVPCDEHYVRRIDQLVLMEPEALTQQPAGAATDDRPADLARSNHTQSRVGIGRHPSPIGNQTTIYEPLALLSHPGEVPALLDAGGAAELQTLWRFWIQLHRRQPFAPDAAAIAQRGAPAFGRVAAQKAVLPFAADFRRLILSLHKSILLPGGAHDSNRAREFVSR